MRTAWEEQGYLLVPDLLAEAETERLAAICDAVLRKWRLREAGEPSRTTNMASITNPAYFDDRGELIDLLELIADDRVLRILRTCLGVEPLFHNTQFFFEQPLESWDGSWHRDTQFDARDDAEEKARMGELTGVHFRVALAADPWLEIVPGSHRRWDTPDELAIRKGSDPTCAAMPGSKRLELAKGDALLFHAWAIHRGSYRTEPIRRTLDIIYGSGFCRFATPPPSCFADRRILEHLSPHARTFFERFVDSYARAWHGRDESPSARESSD